MSQTQSEETATKAPKTRKINRKKNDQPPPSKRQKVEVPDDRILSEQQDLPHVPPQQQLGPTQLVVQSDPSPYSIYEHHIIARELGIDSLWHQLRENKRE